MASQGSVFANGQRADQKVTIMPQCAATRNSGTAQQKQFRNSESAANPHNTGRSTCQCKPPARRHVTGCTADAKTSESGAKRRPYHQHECWEEVKVLDVSRSTFNEIGHDQHNLHNCYSNFVVHHHHNYFHSRWSLEGPDLNTNTQIVSDDCNPTAIVATTIFRTTNVSVVAPYFGIIYSSSEGEEDLILTITRTSVRYRFFSDPK